MAELEEDVGINALAPEPAPEAVIEALEAVIEEPAEVDAPKEGDPEPKPHHLKGKTPWYMERINEETNKRRLIEEQLAQKAREAEESRAMLERLQSGDKTVAAAKSDPQDIDALVEARAEQKLFNQDCNAVAEAGARDIPEFNDKLALLRSIGVVNDDFLKDIFAVDKSEAHRILDHLAQQPEKANLMTRMDSRKRIAELTRIADKMSEPVKPAPPAPRAGVSKVPPPKPVVEAISDDSGETDLTNDKLDDQTWSKLWDRKYRKRA